MVKVSSGIGTVGVPQIVPLFCPKKRPDGKSGLISYTAPERVDVGSKLTISSFLSRYRGPAERS